jgi:hypothetical protein
VLAVRKVPAHDAMMQQATGNGSDGLDRWLARWDWIWWYDFEQMRIKNRSSKKDNDNTFEKAADELLAGCWA